MIRSTFVIDISITGVLLYTINRIVNKVQKEYNEIMNTDNRDVESTVNAEDSNEKDVEGMEEETSTLEEDVEAIEEGADAICGFFAKAWHFIDKYIYRWVKAFFLWIYRGFKKSKLIVKVIVILLIALIVTGIIRHPKEVAQTPVGEQPPTIVHTVIKPVLSDKKFEIIDSIVVASKENVKLNVYSIDLEQEREFTKTWHDFKWLTKSQKATYFGTAKYTVDLSTLDEHSIFIEDDTNTVIIIVPSPRLDTVSVDFDRTEFTEIEHGALSFGDIKFTPEEENAFQADAKQELTKKAEGEEYIDAAKKSAEKQIKALYEKVLEPLNVNANIVIKIV